MGVKSDYFNATIQYLNVLTGDDLVKTTVGNKQAYAFHCPFCSHLVRSKEARNRRTARLIEEAPDTWVFRCSRGFHHDCKGGTRSMHNFLLILNLTCLRSISSHLLGLTLEITKNSNDLNLDYERRRLHHTNYLQQNR